MKLSERDAQNRSITSTGLTPLKSSVTFARVAVSTVRTSTTFDALLHCTAGPAHRRSQTSFSEFDLKSPWHFKAKSLVWSFCFDLFSYLLDRTFREGYRSGTRTSLPVPPRERQPNETIQFSSVQSLDWLGRRGEGGRDMGDFSRDPLPVFSARGPCEQLWHGQGCPVFDLAHTAFHPAASLWMNGSTGSHLKHNFRWWLRDLFSATPW